MKLDRNNPENKGLNKYALVQLRRVKEIQDAGGAEADELERTLAFLERLNILDYGDVGTDSEFFVMRLKDVHSRCGLLGYGVSAMADGDKEYGQEILDMADRAGERHPNPKHPD